MPEPLTPAKRLGHEGGVQAVHQGHLLDHEPEGGDVVRGGYRVAVLEVDLVLARRHLVVGGLDLEAHGLQHQHDVAPRSSPRSRGLRSK